MVKNIRKSIAVVAVVAMLVLTTMTATVSAATPDSTAVPLSTDSSWRLYIVSGFYPLTGVVQNLVPLTDYGITFRCTAYNDAGYSGLYAYGQIRDPWLRATYASGAILKYVGDDGTDIFADDWYSLNGNSGNVSYSVSAYDYVLDVGQYIFGIAR